ncbi:MAG: cytochrome c [Calditrichaeota bacterium]|nr:MAG: cytochrome c [Calditrichota bacterium]
MKKGYKRLVWGTGTVFLLLLISTGLIYWISESRLNHIIFIEPHAPTIPGDSVSIARGKHISEIRGCRQCHGENLAGHLVVDVPGIFRIHASNITGGKGGLPADYSDDDWERAIRHGRKPDGKPLLFMPVSEFNKLSDEDVASLIAYLKSLPPVDNELPEQEFTLIARALYLFGKLPLLPAGELKPDITHNPAPPAGVTKEYGAYLAIGCRDCHGADFKGGPIPGGPPDWPVAPDLTPTGNLSEWGKQGFIRAMRSGHKPDGTPIREPMPTQLLANMTDDELSALWLYLQSLTSTPISK